MVAAPIEFYFDFASPYGYLASTRIDSLAAGYDRAVRWRPILLGALFKITGQGPLPGQPLRGNYALRDWPRFARLLGVPYGHPDPFPVPTVSAARGFYWLRERDEGLARRYAGAVFRAYFAEGRNIGEADTVLAVAGELGIEEAEMRSGLSDAATKARLRAEVEQAVTRGVFGSPFIIVDDEPFWGADRLDQVEHWLRTGGW